VEQIRENPYLQYFLGLSEYSDEAPFESSMMVHFRKRLNLEIVGRINERAVRPAKASGQKEIEEEQDKKEEKEEKLEEQKVEKEEKETEPANQGKSLLDATLVMNLEALLKQLTFLFFAWFMLCRQYLFLQFGKVVLSFSEISYQFRRFPVLPVLWSPFSTCLLPVS
jgi:hypothetical protein